MSITNVKLMDARSIEQSVNENGSSELSCTRTYLVESSSRTESEFNVLFDSGIPVAGAVHPDSSLIRVRSKTANKSLEDAPFKWVVTVQYSSKNTAADPLSMGWRFSSTSNNEMEEMVRDESDTPKKIASSAGEPFESNPQVYVKKRTVTARRFVALSYSDSSLDGWMHTCNDSSFSINGVSYGAGRVLLVSANFGEPQKHVTGSGASTDYKELQLTFEILPSGKRWDELKLYDVGYEELAPDGQRIPILSNETKTKVTRPYPLDGEGGAKANATDTPAELTFKRYKAVSWSGMLS